MSEDIFERQAQEWDAYFQSYDKSKKQLEADEWLIRKNFGISNEALPEEWRNMIDRHRKSWQDQWGVDGWEKSKIATKHAREFKTGNQDHPESPSYTPQEREYSHEADGFHTDSLNQSADKFKAQLQAIRARQLKPKLH